jgi:vitamin B12 transporter
VVVLVDGLRINSLTAGTTALENIPVAQIEKIEILRGPASSLYAAGAIGGVIQIFTKRDTSQKSRVHAAVGLGSYDTKKAEAGIHGKYKDLQYGFNVSSLNTNGFSAIRKRGGTFDKDNDAYNNLSTSGFLELELKPGHTLGLQFFKNQGRTNTDSGNDNFDNYSRQTLQSYAFTSKNQFADFWRSTLTLGKGVDRMTSYALPSAWTRPDGASRFRSDQQQLTWQNDFTLPLGTLTLAYDHLKQKVISTTDYTNTERNNDGFLASYLLNHDKHTVQASLREDHNSQYGNYTTGGLGYGYHVTPAWHASANYGNAFKAPSFNQLYWPGFATPGLTPEKSDNVDVAIQYTGARFNGGITAFQNKIRGLIANSGPASDTCAWGNCPFNIDKVDIQGVTFDGSWGITDGLLLSGNYTVQSPRDEETDQLLVRRGNRYGAINLLHSIGDLQWGTEISGASASRSSDCTRSINQYFRNFTC